MTKTQLENSYCVRKQMAKNASEFIPMYIDLYKENPNPNIRFEESLGFDRYEEEDMSDVMQI